MKITVLNGTEKYGVTYKLKEIFLEKFKQNSEITEFYLPKDCPNFCVGCTNCFLKGESTCKDYVYINAIKTALLEADLIVMTSPCYAMHTTGAMKALLDHFCYLWMSHRPERVMFEKRAVIITQCVGAGAKSTAKDIKDSLSWWGISKIGILKDTLFYNIVWNNLPEKKCEKLTTKVRKFANKFSKINYSKRARTTLITKIKFYCSRFIKKQQYKKDASTVDNMYWKEKGWFDINRPWKQK